MNFQTLSLPKAVLLSTRLPFLLLPLMCVLVGIASAMLAGVDVSYVQMALLTLFCVLAHISVNLFNEYHDFKSGLDYHTQRTPFSGGSGSLPQRPEAAHWVLTSALSTLLLLVIIGLYLMLQVSAASVTAMAIIGVLGLLLIVLYTGPINRSPLLCLIAPGLGFGILMVLGIHLLLVGSVNVVACLSALIIFFLTNNLLLLNQFPDIEADKMAGRKHALIVWGPKKSAFIFALCWALALLSLVLGVALRILPDWALLALLGFIPGAVSITGAFKYGAELGQCPGYLATNVMCALLSPLLLGVGLLMG